MAYVPTILPQYLADCVAQGMDPTTSLDAWIQQQSQSSTIEEPHITTTTTQDTPSTDLPASRSAPPSSIPQQHLSSSTPRPTPPKRFSNLKTNIKLSFAKRLGPFITQTGPIFQEVIGGIATGEIEPEEEQGDRQVHGFVYTREGKRKTVFETPKPIRTRRVSRGTPLPLPPSLMLPAPLSTAPPQARVERATSKRKPKKITEHGCEICANYTQLNLLVGVIPDVLPTIPLMCGSCEFKEQRRRAE
jgi:hypothetical protein